ncbi:MAG: SDR family oxidoreductase [Myxococcota bacterium]
MSNAANFDFSGAEVLVTGGSNGIGYATASAFSQAGASVTVTGTKPDAGAYAVDLSKFAYRQLELSDSDAVDAFADSVDALDVLVNNAGVNFPGGMDPASFEKSVGINLFGAYRLATGLRDPIKKSTLDAGGSVINVASMSAYFAVPLVPGYSAAKAATIQMTKNLAATWAADGIRVNAVAPGLIETKMTSLMKGIEMVEKPFMDRTPMKRWGQPDDIAPAVLFLASSAAKFMTGQTINVDGGYSIA